MNSMENESTIAAAATESSREEEKEHMFDKVVTPSDVGKLNRLVIPKQHAERYFPLDSTTNNIENKGLLLNFEDRTGTSWRFRYSYWNSSQSYVMTKGWSRFVKDKKLDAGDIVSFHRNGVNKLFIDWKRRPKIQDHHHYHHHHHHQSNIATQLFPRLYSYHPLEQFPRNHESLNLWGQNRHFHKFSRDLGYGYLVKNSTAVIDPLVIESVPVNVMMHRRGQEAMAARGGEAGSGKRLRLFGVDMECSVKTTAEEEEEEEEESSSGGGGLLQLRLVSNDESLAMEGASLEDEHHHFSKKGKSSLSFDLD